MLCELNHSDEDLGQSGQLSRLGCVTVPLLLFPAFSGLRDPGFQSCVTWSNSVHHRMASQMCISKPSTVSRSSWAIPFFFFFFRICYFFLAVLDFRCSARASSCCGEWQLLFRCGTRVSHCGGVSCCRAQALGTPASIAVAHVLSCPAACGILVSGPGIKPMFPAWADEFLTTGALGKTLGLSFY